MSKNNNILFNETVGVNEITIYYEISNEEVSFIQITKCVDKKEALFHDDTKLTYIVNEKELFSNIKEKELKKKFGNSEGFHEFRNFIDEKNINHRFVSEDL